MLPQQQDDPGQGDPPSGPGGGPKGEDIQGTSGNDALYGTPLADTLHGLLGNDTLHGLGGDDALYGDGGNDTIDPGPGWNVIDGGAGVDTVSYASDVNPVFVALANDPGLASQFSYSSEHDQLYGIENVVGSDHADVIYGTASANVLTGGAGNDMIHGVGGQDTLDAGAGDDHLFAGPGDETMAGGAGGDQFYFLTSSDHASGKAVITDFAHNADRLELGVSAGDSLNLADLDTNHDGKVGAGDKYSPVVAYGNSGNGLLIDYGHAVDDVLYHGQVHEGSSHDTVLLKGVTSLGVDDFVL